MKTSNLKRKSPSTVRKGTRKPTSNTKKSRLSNKNYNNNDSFLSQLQRLRDFTSGCGEFSESDLSKCLRHCRSNVEMAAEHLITGQYKNLAICSSSAQTTSTTKKLNEIHNKSSVSASSKVSEPSNQISASNETSQNKHKSAYRRKLSKSNSQEECEVEFVKQTQSSSIRASSRQKQTPNLWMPKKKTFRSGQQHHQHKTSCGTGTDTIIDTDTGVSAIHKPLLLCHRWICGLSTSRRGSIRYNEDINIHASPKPTSVSSVGTASVKMPKGGNIVRFKGDRIEGTLGGELSSFLAPLLRGTPLSLNSNSKEEKEEISPLIEIRCKTLMEDLCLEIGMEVPLELYVYITRPDAFFELFGETSGSSSGHAIGTEFWNTKKKAGTTCVAKAAFDLLQWAHYSSLPKFDSNRSIMDSKASEDEDADPDVENTLNSKPDLVAEEEPDWAKELLSSSTPSSGVQVEEADPVMLQEKGIVLRTYQRQALSWMMNREEGANMKGSIQLQKQLELLSELANREHGQGDCASISKNGHGVIRGVKCAVGPVLVSSDLAAKSSALDGEENPAIHPLWQRRFLWDRECEPTSSDDVSGDEFTGKVHSFYVNELLQLASKSAPPTCRECCGGILSDSMGLGKTVMLLSLIAKDKEQAYQMSTFEKYEEHKNGLLNSADDGSDNTKKLSGSINFTGPRTTLIVAPLSLLGQWEEEIHSKTSLSCMTYYGDQAKRISSSTITGVDVLLTTYGTLQSEFFSSDAKSLSQMKSKINSTATITTTVFRRVILDEAHFIKNAKTKASKACCQIKAERRWCVTGTPISNSLHDVFGLLKFLKHEPWCIDGFWKKAIKSGKQSNNKANESECAAEDEEKMSRSIVCRVLRPVLLRRTKDTLGEDGKPILTLPPIESTTIRVTFSQEERHFYNVLLSKSQSAFDGLIKAGASKSWFAIFALLQRLRQSCDHLALTMKSQMNEDPAIDDQERIDVDETENKQLARTDQSDNFIKELLVSFKKKSEDSPTKNNTHCFSQSYSEKVVMSLTQCIETNGTLNEECAICLEIPSTDNLAVTPCSHVFCKPCLLDSLKRKKSKNDNGECPMCSLEVAESDVICTQSNPSHSEDVREVTKAPGKEETMFDAKTILAAALNGKCSSKIASILQELDKIWKEDPGSKILIFSQYLGMFDFLKQQLDQKKIVSLRLDGKMSLKERQKTLKRFNSNGTDETSHANGLERGVVLLASMKACGVGLNLTAASSVFIVDPWWNHALENQCINRIHRIGQRARRVRVRKFIVDDSVEEKIVKMQERKKGMANEVLSDKATTSRSSNPTLEDFKSIFGR